MLLSSSVRCVAFLVLGSLPAARQGIPVGRAVRAPRVLRVPDGFATIQSAIDAARDGDVVLVGPGTWTGTLNFLGKSIEVVAPAGPARTTLRPSSGPVVRFQSGEGPDTKLIGFRITGGLSEDTAGGGVTCVDFNGDSSRPHLLDCVIEQNFSDLDFGVSAGAGVGGDPILERCVVRRNIGFLSDGAGVYGAPTMLHCVVEENEACDGAGLFLLSGARLTSTLVRANVAGPCNYRGNEISSEGGGVLVAGSDIVLERCVLWDNSIVQSPEGGFPDDCHPWMQGGALAGSGATLRRCTVTGNRPDQCATVGGLAYGPTLVDSIVHANDDPAGQYLANPGVRFSCVDGGGGGPGNVDVDPLFLDPSAGDFRLHEGSPCIDAGDPLGALDPDGTRADMGAYPTAAPFAPPGVAWREGPLFTPLDPDDLLGFGVSVAMDGDTALVGAQRDFEDTVHVFRRAAGVWQEEARLATTEPMDYGSALDLEGDVCAVGAPLAFGDGFFGPGAVFVHERGGPGELFGPGTLLRPSNPVPGELFGSALALDGGYLAVGCPHDAFEDQPGRVVVFQRLARGLWREVAVLEGPPTDQTLFGSGFGTSVGLSGRTLVVGEPLRESNFEHAGVVHVFERAGRSPYSWVLSRTLPVPVENVNGLGFRVEVDGDSILATSSAGLYAYERDQPGLPWGRARRVDSAPFGQVLLDGDRAWHVHGGFPDPSFHARTFVQPSPGADWVAAGGFDLPSVTRAAMDGESLLIARFSQGVREYTLGVQLDRTVRDQAADEETLTLVGAGLDEVTEVRLDGAPEPIVAQTPTTLSIRPARRDPGFVELALDGPGGTLVLPGGLSALPTLHAETEGPGGLLTVDLDNGEAGAFLLRHAFALRPTPLVLSSPATWYHFLLTLGPGTGTLTTDAFPLDGRASVAIPIPADPALAGETLYLQAWCRRGLFGPGRFSFTNLGAVTF